ncbi:sulfotransferase domain-containing protein [Lysobacter sp. TAF61]|uniref:sulfotransferase domain-containing protein n=1 Tax=Lysobacter sp. TAF61 TaxID=3233072 RepID=UPI003F9E0BFE
MSTPVLTRPIVVSEFPKSGGSWIVSLLGAALQVPCRDLYVRPGFDLFDISSHPWYRDVEAPDFPVASVIKSQELPGSTAVDFDATFVHLVRDGRDVVTSKFFFERDFCVKNGISASFDEAFGTYSERQAREWAAYVDAWKRQKDVPTIRYESFLADPVRSVGALVETLTGSSHRIEYLEAVVQRFARERFADSLASTFKYNTFVRRGVSGDWQNHFSNEVLAAFLAAAGQALEAFGYSSEPNGDLNA